MKFITRVCLALILCTCIVTAAAGEPSGDVDYSNEFGPGYMTGVLWELLPGAEFIPGFLENYASDTTMVIEESNGFSWLDRSRIYFDGESTLNFRWEYAGMDISSSLNPGSAGVMLPLRAMNSFRLQGRMPGREGSGFSLDAAPRGEGGVGVTLSGVLPDMGGLGPGAETMILNHPYNRAERLYTTRRRFNGQWQASGVWQGRLGSGDLRLSLTAMDQERQFNDFNARDRVFSEGGRAVLAAGHFRSKTGTGIFEAYSVFNSLERSAMNAELGRLPEETADMERISLLTGVRWKSEKGLDLRGSILMEKENRIPAESNFTKEMMDNDGDGLWPEDAFGDLTSTIANLEGRIRLWRSGGLKLEGMAGIRHTWNGGEERAPGMTGAVLGGSPWLGLAWSNGTGYDHRLWNAHAGFRASLRLTRKWKLLADLELTHSGMSFSNDERNISWSSPALDMGMIWDIGKRTRLFLALGTSPVQPTSHVSRFLDPGRPGALVYHWGSDLNGDGIFQTAEASGMYGVSGAPWHHVDGDLKAPRRDRLAIEFTTPLSRRWSLDIRAVYKRFHDLLTVDYAGEFGHMETVDNLMLYLLDQPVSGYVLTNSSFEKDPFYGQFRFTIRGQGKRWLFSFSFMAHMGMGSAPLGNGAVANDPGTLSELQAGPNNRWNAFGRLDGDRAFIFRVFSGFHLNRNLFLAISLKYRDGDPFAFIDAVGTGENRLLVMQTIRAEDSHGRKGGPREDYLSDCSVQLSWDFHMLGARARLTAAVFNLLDFGSELSEYVFSGGSRDAMEMQLPRSMRLSLSLSW